MHSETEALLLSGLTQDSDETKPLTTGDTKGSGSMSSSDEEEKKEVTEITPYLAGLSWVGQHLIVRELHIFTVQMFLYPAQEVSSTHQDHLADPMAIQFTALVDNTFFLSCL